MAGLTAADEIVAKAAAVSEISQIARIEVLLREYLLSKWNVLSSTALKIAVKHAESLSKSEKISNDIEKVMKRFPGEVKERLAFDVGRIYKLSRIAAWKKVKTRKGSLSYDMTYFIPTQKAKAELLPSFDVQDVKAVESITKYQYFWIGDHYERTVRDEIRDTTKKVMLEAGQDRTAAGKLMSTAVKEKLDHVKMPSGWTGTQRAYYEGLTANAATVARAYGNLRSFREGGITRYEINNPNDDRTCPVCAHMDGKVFTVEHGFTQIEKEMGTIVTNLKTHTKNVHPWLSPKQLREISPSPGRIEGKAGEKDSQALAAAGQACPPYHFLCRCALDISEEIGSWSEVPEEDVVPKTPTITPGDLKPSAVDKMLFNMTTSEVESIESIGGKNTNAAKKVTLKTQGGEKIEGVWKPASGEVDELRIGVKGGTYHQRETAMYEIDRMMGGDTVIPPTISRHMDDKSGPGSYQLWSKGAATESEVSKKYKVMPDSWKEMRWHELPSARRTFLMDVIGANDDRHQNNVLFKVLKNPAVKDKLEDTVKMVAIDNGLSFPNTEMARFLFPGDAYGKNAAAFLNLDVESMRLVRNLKIREVARTLSSFEDIDAKSIKSTLVRIKALQNDPDAITKLSGSQPALKVERFVEQSLRYPADLVDEKSLKEIDEIMKDIISARDKQ